MHLSNISAVECRNGSETWIFWGKVCSYPTIYVNVTDRTMSAVVTLPYGVVRTLLGIIYGSR